MNDPRRSDVLVIGAGQAGLSVSHHLDRLGLQHLVLDAEEGPGGAWRHRWPTLTMGTVNGIRELPDSTPPAADADEPANRAIPEWFGTYERDFGIEVERPVRIRRVTSVGDRLLAHAADGRSWSVRALANATGTWRKPFWPSVPGRDSFTGTQLHTHDYPGPQPFAGKRVVVVGGGISAVQHLLEIAPLAAGTLWVTRRPPIFTDGEFGEERGRAAVAMVADRVSKGLAPRSVVSVTGLPLTPAVRDGIHSGVLNRLPMFSAVTADGVAWSDGRRCRADVILWATGFRHNLDHLAPLHLRSADGGIVMDGQQLTRVAKDHRIQLVGYGPGASTIGANRAGRAAAREIQRLLDS
ncbi:NAD(P)-binding domain-containing protein [Naumannella halotolerans]|uniref:Pyridine nucleotide-disulfide oxidoreductase n=1 Tax=Naumannella halotolerans TaxID=993414 RepID=A0A4R7J1U4_9ACTN|nr:NAD(P)-binding domain-containing protein [Naumannella halotolerans]TDT30985.1 pyridine nucleotide-disulfide oxidoreductase [Naumannella halotolerans]